MADGALGSTRERESGGTPVPAATAPPREPSRGWLALAGAIAGAAGLALSQGVSEALGADDSPLSAVAAAVRDLTPGHLAIHLVELVRHLDKPLLVGGTAVAFLAICAYAGSWARRSPNVPDITFLVLAALGVAAVLRLPEPPLAAVVAVVVGLLTWLISFRVLSAPVLVRRDEDFSRRDFVLRTAAVVVVVGAASVAGRVVSSGRRKVEEARRTLQLPVSRGTAPSGSTIGVKGIEPWRTPNDDFYIIDTTISPPSISPADWELRIHGMVENEVRISWSELIKRPMTEAWITLCCVSNVVGGDLIGNAFWSGVPVRELLAQARPLAGADAVKQTSKDGWTCGTPLPVLIDPQPQRDARRRHERRAAAGAPRLPGADGGARPLRLRLGDQVGGRPRGDHARQGARLLDRAWLVGEGTGEDPVAHRRPRQRRHGQGRHRPRRRQRLGAAHGDREGRVPARRRPVAGGRAGPGPRPGHLGAVGRIRRRRSAGDHRLYVRATDKSGYTQTAVKADVIPNGATGWDTHPFTAR